MTHDEIIAVVQAHKDHRGIERKPKGDYPWIEDSFPAWDFARYDYRVTQKPREVWCVYNPIYMIYYAFETRMQAEIEFPGKTYVRFIEAPETPSQNAKAKNP